MQAELVLQERFVLGDRRFAEIVIWRVPTALPGSPHEFKYRLALVVERNCVLRFDNEAGKGDHKHIGEEQVAYEFTTLAHLIDDFWEAVIEWRPT
jgi:hypothetical protein